MKKYSYIGIAFIILIFGIYAIPKIVNRFKTPELITISKKLHSIESVSKVEVDVEKSMVEVTFEKEDTIEKITHATGLDVVAKTVANSLGFEDCGCEERKRILNEKFPYIFPKFKK